MILREKDKIRLVNIFSGVDLPVEVWAYGSRVDGTAHEGSDLDLVIKAKSDDPVPTDLYHELIETIRESNIPILVELHDWGRLPETFQKKIQSKHEVLFSNLADRVNDPGSSYQAEKEQ